MKKEFENVMCDLETLGRTAGCAILSIGAVFFDVRTGVIGPMFYEVISRRSCKNVGLFEDPETVAWWSDQSPEARKAVFDSAKAKPIQEVLWAFNKFLVDNAKDLGSVRLMGNGADFDNAILQAAYKACNLVTAWDFWNNFCYRTLKNLSPGIRMGKRTGTHHNALDDAINQANHAIALLRFQEHARKHRDVAIIAAADNNGLIGADGKIPWYITDDLRRFKQLTNEATIIMGRKTWDSLPVKPLPGRRNMVLSQQYFEGKLTQLKGAEVYASLEAAISAAVGPVYVIGGGQVYAQALKHASRIELTHVKGSFEGDTYFPILDSNEWVEVLRQARQTSDGLKYDYVSLIRRMP